MTIGTELGERLLRIAMLLAGIAALFLLVTAIADVRLDQAPAPEPEPAQVEPAQDPDTEVGVIVHEGGIGEVEAWVTEKADATLSTVEDARQATRDVLQGLGDLVGL